MIGYLKDRLLRFKPRCKAVPPLDGADLCCRPKGHERWAAEFSPDWHSDGYGYIWRGAEWKWMGI